jgi:hypothetical protein
MKNAAIALFMLSAVVSLAGAYRRGKYVYAEEQPNVSSHGAARDAQKRLYVGFFVIAALGLIFACTNVLAFSVFRVGNEVAFWAVVAAGSWSAAALLLFVMTYHVSRET